VPAGSDKDAESSRPVRTLYGCGLRASEVVRLKVGDIDIAQGIVRVAKSKGRARTVT
jgi:integrase